MLKHLFTRYGGKKTGNLGALGDRDAIRSGHSMTYQIIC